MLIHFNIHKSLGYSTPIQALIICIMTALDGRANAITGLDSMYFVFWLSRWIWRVLSCSGSPVGNGSSQPTSSKVSTKQDFGLGLPSMTRSSLWRVSSEI